MMRPWDIKVNNGKRPDDSFTLPLWSTFFPEDFYFATHIIDSIPIVYIVPSEFYDDNAKMYHDSMPIVSYLPNYLEETLEGVYECDDFSVSIETIIDDMIKRGFIHDHFFQTFIDANFESPHIFRTK